MQFTKSLCVDISVDDTVDAFSDIFLRILMVFEDGDP
jgi:hypothetical protein